MRKKTRRMLTLLLAAVLAFALTACGSTGGETEPQSTKAPETTLAPAPPEKETEPAKDPDPTYSLVQNVYNWGSSYSKIILPIVGADGVDYTDVSKYTVAVQRYDAAEALLDEGTRVVTAAYLSNAEGVAAADGEYVTLEMEVGAAISLSAPYYTDPNSFYGQLKAWATCKYDVTNADSGEKWNQLNTVYHPDEEAFATGTFTASDATVIPFASYAPAEDGANHPLIVWLHGAGSGGTDIGFVTGGMLVTNFISEESQAIFGGAHVLLPQSVTFWLDDGGQYHYTQDGTSTYTKAMMELIEEYCTKNPSVDKNRIYIGGCSAGGFMTMNMLLNYPDYFAATFPVCGAYADAWITEDQLQSIKDIPAWFVHCSADPVVDPTTTTNLTYDRFVTAGAADVHYTQYASIVDPDYGNEYGGHFAWVPALKNLCNTNLDGSPVVVNGAEVNLFQWLATQSK